MTVLVAGGTDPKLVTGAGPKAMSIFNHVFNYFYLGLLIMCFILALGNRPQGSKWGYTLAILGFALITVYMTVSWR